MLQQFKTYIQENKLFGKKDKVLLTVSGGVDSVVLCDLFYKAGVDFSIAHCNFQLRGDESEGDESFVETLAEKYQTVFHTVQFDTSSYAKKNKLSIQVAARELRYSWFEELRTQFNYSSIATAHHQNDSIETFFINLIRGAGISGLHGILPKSEYIIRPLLFCNKEEIVKYAKKNKILFREDSSNASDKYVRNKIRQQVIPALKEINPQLENTITNNLLHLREVELVYKNQVEKLRKKIVLSQKQQTIISIKALKKTEAPGAYLFEFLKPFSFNEATVQEVLHAMQKTSGKQFFSPTHRLIKDREQLIIEAQQLKAANTSTNPTHSHNLKILKHQKEIQLDDLHLHFNKVVKKASLKIDGSAHTAQLDYDKLTFPLQLRKWEKGDSFYPLGMKNKKKLSDFFIDNKLALSEKENCWLLTTSQNKIIWVVGYRIDDRFKITPETKNVIIIKSL